MELSQRQLAITEIVKEKQPISGEKIAKILGLSRATLRNDFSILTMTGVLQARPKVGYVYAGAMHQNKSLASLLAIPVKDIMIPPLNISQENTIYDAITTLFMYDVGSLYVVNEAKELVGLLSRKDLLRASLNKMIDKTPVTVVMTRLPQISTCLEDDELFSAAEKLRTLRVDSLPVLKKNNPKIAVGKITKTRIHDYLIEKVKE
ncbi:helix-turn-helix transcriptional regulator [Enterococcus dispar]|uniref:helix-turn-helix transcriptional regulator n=1 Tax=Enterococcus dispar TaxID=44009 RepID=UPI0021D471B4|nr:helix-turn-helix transcriptional regulator [Enterococcus dispar]MCU7358190.1 helix-turn-helix transcriptional regulator [Enterococcus dispar]MDT2705708.1 helix-turn-helix transcriptional regulator [Enterococcus dispar]WCG32939.1 helix-turn-helix transcriptional regulator [Enterococcus dispar]